MENVTVPIVPVDKEDEVAKKILKSSADEPEESNTAYFEEDDFFDDIDLILVGIGMEKYINLFRKSIISLDTFLKLDESDLRELGITDTNDIEIIMKNLGVFGAKEKKFSVPDNSLHDLQIARNVSNELILLQNYCSYLELQMRKHKLTDYRINWKESASTYMKAFTKAASLQAKIISQWVFNDLGDNHLIGKTLKLNNVILSDHLKEKLKKKKPRGRLRIISVVVFFGILSLAVIIKTIK